VILRDDFRITTSHIFQRARGVWAGGQAVDLFGRRTSWVDGRITRATHTNFLLAFARRTQRRSRCHAIFDSLYFLTGKGGWGFGIWEADLLGRRAGCWDNVRTNFLLTLARRTQFRSQCPLGLGLCLMFACFW